MSETEEILRRYDALLDLYGKLEIVSVEICRILETGSSFRTVTEGLNEKKALVERIEQESQAIASMKKNAAVTHFLSDEDRALVKAAEEKLARVVNSVIDLSTKMYELMMKQGANVTR